MSLQHYFLKCFSKQMTVSSKKLVLTFLSKEGRALYSSSDSSDEENGKPKSNKAKKSARDLLSSLGEDKEGKKLRSSHSILNNLREDTNMKVNNASKSGDKIVLKEETKKKMMDLLMTISTKTYSKDEEMKLSQAQEKNEINEEEKDVEFIDFSVKEAVKNVADLLGGDKAKTESELLQSLKSVTSPKHSLRDIVSTMKVSKPEKPLQPVSRLHEFRKVALPESQRSLDRQSFRKVDVFGAEPLNIFPKDFKPECDESILSVWDSLLEREKKLSVSQQPKNYFEEMINWTEKGKVWTFPIDNEIGLEEEKSYTFADHIFLEKHLEGWCPKKGPIRHYMELICIGLSKNPYLTVDRKIAHIEWQRNYFDDKKELLKDLGAL